MKVSYYQDNTLTLDLERLVVGLNDLSAGVVFSAPSESVSIAGNTLSCPDSYENLKLANGIAISGRDLAFIATTKRYDNNYFYDYPGEIGIFSFAGWEHLTKLPIIN